MLAISLRALPINFLQLLKFRDQMYFRTPKQLHKSTVSKLHWVQMDPVGVHAFMKFACQKWLPKHFARNISTEKSLSIFNPCFLLHSQDKQQRWFWCLIMHQEHWRPGYLNLFGTSYTKCNDTTVWNIWHFILCIHFMGGHVSSQILVTMEMMTTQRADTDRSEMLPMMCQLMYCQHLQLSHD